ncbi:MAG: hypothetical protein JW797_12190 [Bradymonadales bacterium]|nr:hypothetical protein [Bradymonadales bacterium]
MKELLAVTAGVFLLVLVTSSTWAQEPLSSEESVAPASPATTDATVQTAEPIALEQTATEAEDEEEESKTFIHPFSLSASISNTFSLGAIFRDEYTVQNYDLMSFGLSGSYQTPHDPLSLSLSIGFNKFLTESGGSTYQREGRFGDMDLSASYAPIFTDEWYTGISLSGGLSITIPTSRYSRFTNLYTSLSPSLSLSRSFGKLSLRYGFAFSKNFHEHTTVVVDLTDYRLDILARDGGAENIAEGQIALDTGVLSSFSISNSFSISYSWFSGFSTALSFGLSDYWTYDNGTITQQDEFTSPNAVPGRGHGQGMNGSISVSYSFLDYFSTSLAMSTSQEPLTADHQSVRFPFFDLETGNLQNTSITLSLSASY